ncbi:MAG: hypothetical protein RIR18_2361 [Pseudomonadota bacterium]
MEHIERCLLWKGELQRADIVAHFGVNPAQAAADFRDYMLAAPGNMDYNKSRKRYLPSATFAPKFIRPASIEEFSGLPSTALELQNWPLPQRKVSPDVLTAVIKATTRREALEIRYQSMSNPRASWRWISPHSFASDGDRWHVRAFCHKNNEFRDFVVSRIDGTRNCKASEIDSLTDADWHSFVQVKLLPNPQLSERQQAAIASEYQMPRENKIELSMRKSMVFYLEAKFSPAPESVPAAHQMLFAYKKATAQNL